VASKLQFITELSDRTAHSITDNHINWTSFLTTAAWNYKYKFQEQLLIFAQRPDVTACAPIEIWNNLGRWVNRGAKGIALIDDKDGTLKLRHVFDVSDTSSRYERPIQQWSMLERYNDSIIEALENSFGELAAKYDLVSALVSVAHNAVDDNFTDYLSNLLNVRGDSFLEELDELNVEARLKNALESSVAYALLTRCGIDANVHYNFEDFKYVFDFNTSETVAVLGDATSDISEMALREIGETIKNLHKAEKNKIRTFAEKGQNEYHNDMNKTERSFDYGTDLYNAGRLPTSRPDTTDRAPNREIWNVAQNISQKPQERDLRRDDDFGQANAPFNRDRQDSKGSDRTDNVTDDEGTRNNRAAQSNRPNEMGWDDEQHQALSGGNSAERVDLQLEYYNRETEDKSLPFFHSDKYINDILKTTPHLKATKQEIINFYATHIGNDERKEYIKSIFNNDYTELTVDDDHQVGYKTYQNVLHLWESSYNSRNSQGYYDWGVIANHFEGLILLNELIDTMKPLPSVSQQISFMEKAEEEKPSVFTFSQEIIDYNLQRGSGVEDGKYRIYEQFLKNQLANHNERFLSKEYGIGGASPIISGTGIGEWHDGKGITISMGESKQILSWSKAAKRIGELITTDRYLSAKEKEYYPIYLQKQEERRQQLAEEKIARDIISRAPIEIVEPTQDNVTYNFHLGDTVFLGASDYEVLSFDDNTVRLYDVSFPLINKEIPRESFNSMLRENALNDHLKETDNNNLEVLNNVSGKDKQPTEVTAPTNKGDGEKEYDLGYGSLGNGTTVWNRLEQVNGDYKTIAHIADDGTVTLIDKELPQHIVDEINAQAVIEAAQYQVDNYGYDFGDYLTDVTRELALELYDHNFPIYMCYPDNTESLVNDRDEILTFDGYFGIENNEFPSIRGDDKSMPFVGRIDFLNSEGGIGEVVIYRDVEQFVKDIKKENFYGTPMSITVYRGTETIPIDWINELDPPPAGFKFVDVLVPYKEPQETEPITPTWEKPKAKSRVQSFDLYPMIATADRLNFRINNDELGIGGAKEKFSNNLASIKLLKQLESECRYATPAEQEILSKYVGFGGLSQAFDEKNGSWANEYMQLKALLDESEYTAARESTLTAFYTAPVVIRAMYKAMENMGFKNGNILEPSCGTGNFLGMVPESMQDCKMYGVELDSITGRIAQQLYQKSSIAVQGFEQTSLPDSFFDLAIGNVPFGQFKVADRRYDKQNFLIHDYFFAKTLDKVRPGGVIAFITSKGTLDKENPVVRKYIAQRADLLGAIRLPNNAFKANAGTDVTADIIFLQKRDRIIDIEPDWVHLGKDENDISMNSYFVENPDMLMGEMVMESTQYGMDSTCKPYIGADLETMLNDAISNIHAEVTEYEYEDLSDDEDKSIPADFNVRNFSYTIVDGKLYFRENSRMNPVDVAITAENRIKGMLGIRDCVRNLIEYQIDDYPDSDIKEEQDTLNRLFDTFTKKYGLINSRANNMAFSEDSSYCLLCSLEVIDENGELARKADMFTKRTIKQHTTVTSVDTASEALAVSIAERACVDMGFMQSLTRRSQEEFEGELAGVIFRNPTLGVDIEPHFETADEYLSGNVREKLIIAKQFADIQPDLYTVNVQALEAVQPKDLTASEICVRLGATWLPPEFVKQFMFELLGTSRYLQWDMKVHYSNLTSEWNIEGKNQDRANIKANNTYGSNRINGYKIIEETLNLKDVRIFDYIEDAEGKKQQVLNKKETTIAQQKQELIKAQFAEWIWKDPERREQLCRLYNDKFNSIRPREYDGSHIKFSGINPEISLRPHQVNAIAHIMYGGNTLLAHVVGAGKTFEMVAASIESKRLGLCQKSLFVVPNHLTEQWASEFLQLYPSANILVATKKDFETKSRKKFCGRIATGDYDAVIIGHSQFEKIPMSIERQHAILGQQLDEITYGIAELKSNRGENFSIKQLEKTKKTIKLKLDKLNDQSRKDDVVTFEELGVDRIFIDEAHYYKNLFLYTKMRNVGGIAQTEAQKSSDLFMKCRYLDELTGGRGIIFATGTPISNSMTEMYTMQRYLQYNTLERNGLQHFDSWASTFGETVTAIELAPEGTGYRAKTRFAKFYNLPELMAMFKDVADIQTADMLNLPVPKANYHNVVIKPSELQVEMVAGLSERADRVRNKMVDASVDNMLLITNDGRKLALDQRLANKMLPDFENSKVAICANNIFDVWEKHKEKSSAQLVFCDLSTPHYDGSFNVYDDIKQKLKDKGIPEDEIAFIHDANSETQKKELFGKVRSGHVRVLIGSTQKMGSGTNVQHKLVALHDLDCPWRPSDLEQRSGRILRQGNTNPEVEIFRYVTEQTFDAYLFQLVENKQKFISQIMTSKSPVRSAEDIDETALSYAEIKALATGNPFIKEKMDLDIDVARLKLLKANHLSQRYSLEDQIIKYFPQQIKSIEERIKGYKLDIAHLSERTKLNADKFSPMIVGGVTYTEKADAGKAILESCKKMTNPDPIIIGEYRGFTMELFFDSFSREYKLSLKNELSYSVALGSDVHGNITRLDNTLEGFEVKLQACEEMLANNKTQLENAKVEVERPFAQDDDLKTKSARLDELNILLNMDQKDSELMDSEPDEVADAPIPKNKEYER
jgi:N12 class adenine-specific DNA methylase